MNLEWTNSGGGRGPGASDCQGVEAPGPLACARKNGHLIGDQTSEYDRRQSITQGGRGGNTRETEESAHPPRYQQGHGFRPRAAKGGRTCVGQGGGNRHAARGAETSSGGWWVLEVDKVQANNVPL